MSYRPLAFVSGLTLGDYLLWNWSLNANHDVLALVSGLTLPPLALACSWMIAATLIRIVRGTTRRSGPGREATSVLLDQRMFREWLDLLAEDLVYFMPIRRNVKFGHHTEKENTRQGEGISWFDEDKWTLGKRVEQILTGVHYAEEPLSRVTHMVSNVRLLEVAPSTEAATEAGRSHLNACGIPPGGRRRART